MELNKKVGCLFAAICLCTASLIHADGGGMMGKMLNGCNTDSYRWKSMSDSEYVKKKVESYNRCNFTSHLSRFGMYEWMHFSPEQQRQALSMADNADISPDQAVFTVAKSS